MSRMGDIGIEETAPTASRHAGIKLATPRDTAMLPFPPTSRLVDMECGGFPSSPLGWELKSHAARSRRWEYLMKAKMHRAIGTRAVTQAVVRAKTGW